MLISYHSNIVTQTSYDLETMCAEQYRIVTSLHTMYLVCVD